MTPSHCSSPYVPTPPFTLFLCFSSSRVVWKIPSSPPSCVWLLQTKGPNPPLPPPLLPQYESFCPPTFGVRASSCVLPSASPSPPPEGLTLRTPDPRPFLSLMDFRRTSPYPLLSTHNSRSRSCPKSDYRTFPASLHAFSFFSPHPDGCPDCFAMRGLFLLFW